MQRRLLAFLGIVGALVGLVVLFVLLGRERPSTRIEEVIAPPPVVEPPPDEGLRAEKQHGTVQGRVINGVSERPIQGAKVIALFPYLQRDEDDELPLWGQQMEETSVLTDAQGRFAIEALPPNYWNLWVEKAGYAWTTVPRAKFNKDYTIKLYPACSIRGRVVYPDESPAAGVRIEYTPQGTHSEVFSRYRLKDYYIETDSDGRFEYTEIPPGKFTVEVYPRDHLPAPWKYEPPLKPGENRDLGTHKLDPGFGMTVFVKYMGSHEPVEGIEVKVVPVGDPMPRTKKGRRVHTDADGKAVFSGLGGQVIEKPRFMVAANVPGVGPVMPDEARLFSANETVTIYLRRDAILRGKVLGGDGQPLARFHVSASPVGFVAHQIQAWGEKGEFILYQVPEGVYDVHVRHGGLVDKSVRVTALAGQEVDVGTISLRQGGEIHGTVRNANGAPLEGLVRVHLARTQYDDRLKREEYVTVTRTICEADGAYRLRGIPSGSFLIWPQNVEKGSRTTEPQPISIAHESDVVQRDLLIYGEGRLKIVFYDDIEGNVRQVVFPPTFLLERATGKEIRWLGEGTALRPGVYDLSIELKNADGVPKRYRLDSVRIQEDEVGGPIEVRLYEIRDGGPSGQVPEESPGD